MPKGGLDTLMETWESRRREAECEACSEAGSTTFSGSYELSVIRHPSATTIRHIHQRCAIFAEIALFQDN
jgi:hypothetical protein